jgi:hypothetical protein
MFSNSVSSNQILSHYPENLEEKEKENQKSLTKRVRNARTTCTLDRI